MHDEFRKAIKDKRHPMHKAAWAIFSPSSIKLKYADKVLANQREEVIRFALAVIDDDALIDQGSLGDGFAPINAVELLGHWEVVEAIPRMLVILDDTDWDTMIHDRVIAALGQQMPLSIRDDMLALAKEKVTDPETEGNYINILLDLYEREPYEPIWEWCIERYHAVDDHYMLVTITEIFLFKDEARMKPILRRRVKDPTLPRALRDELAIYLED